MLKIEKSASLTGSSMIDNQLVANFTAQIQSEAPAATIQRGVVNAQLYEANAKTVREDQRAFEDYVFGLEDEAMATPVAPETVGTAPESESSAASEAPSAESTVDSSAESAAETAEEAPSATSTADSSAESAASEEE